MGFLAVAEYREVDGYLPAQAARETKAMIYETCFPYFGGKSSAFLEMDTMAVPGEGENKVHGDGLVHYEYIHRYEQQ